MDTERPVNLRSLAYWLVDGLKGGVVRRHCRDLEAISRMSPFEQRRTSESRAREMAAFAIRNVPFYAGLDPATSFERMPVVNKSVMREDIGRFIASGRSTADMRKAMTSGSTGTPFVVYQDRDKRARMEADTIYWGAQAGYGMGEVLFYLRIWTKALTKGAIYPYLTNIWPVDVSLQTPEELEAILRRMLACRGRYSLLGYVSSLEALCQHVEATGPRSFPNPPRGILTMSESLDGGLRNRLLRQFGVWPVSRYSNIENGLVAQQPRGPEDYFVLNHGSFHVEVLSEASDQPVKEGEAGRIVVTDLFNKGMPFVRYDTGDIGAFSKDKEGRLVIGRVEGRRMDQISDARGRPVSPLVVNNQMLAFPEMRQYQFIQRAHGDYLVKVNLPGGFARTQELIAMFKSLLGEDAQVAVEMVEEIPVLNSGKRKKVVNLMERQS